MANNKTNIYPIQLQGAELNLNKFDAEIKQYSGFNKNNSPFVGGCLTNVFNKDVTIEGSNSKNTYIAPNGDVYRVDITGLYKNGSKIIDYPATTKFYNKRKLNIDTDSEIVKVVSESVYVTIEHNLNFPASVAEGKAEPYVSDGYVAHWGDGFTKVLCSVENLYPSFIDISYKEGVIVFSVKRYYKTTNVNYDDKNLITILFVKDEEENNFTFLTPDDDVLLNQYESVNHPEYNISQTAFITDNGNTVMFCSNACRGDGDNVVILYKYQNDIYEKITSIYGEFNSNQAYVDGVLYYIASEMLFAWCMTRNGDFIFIGGDEDNNELTGFNFDRGRWCTVVRLSTEDLTITEGKYGFSKLTTSHFWVGYFDNRVISPDYVVTMNKFEEDDDDETVTDPNMFYLRQAGGLFGFVKKPGNTEDTGYIFGDVYCNGDFKILVNEGFVSNIAIADMTYDWLTPIAREDGSLHGVILEEWNSISDIILTDNKLIYKKGRDYFVIEQSSPMLSYKSGQLVVNCNNEKNSYDINLKRILHFASDWNCSYVTTSSYHFPVKHKSEYEGLVSGFLASSINEYKQEYNPSILLNMLSVYYEIVTDIHNSVNLYTFIMSSTYWKNYLTDALINFYSGSLESNKAEYYISSSGIKKFDLKGLPYPNNSDGNVQYNLNLFSELFYGFGDAYFVKENTNAYQLIKENGSEIIMAYFLGTLVENIDALFVIQGQYYAIIRNMIYSCNFSNGIIQTTSYIVNVQGLQFVGNTPYEALFYSKTNRCLYSFTGANVLTQRQLVDKISEVRNYLYNPATQTVFLITDIGVFFYGIFGQFLLEYTDIADIFLLDNGIVMGTDAGLYHYIKYYLDAGDEDYQKNNIELETCFYGMNNEMVTINDCLYFRLFSEEHEEGNLKVSATTISLRGRKTEETTFRIKASDWDKITHSIFLRYQPKEQRGLGVSFTINSPFKIASLSVGSQPDAVLIDKVSKGAITAPQRTSNNVNW